MPAGDSLTIEISPALYKAGSARGDDAVRASVRVPSHCIKNDTLHLRSNPSFTPRGRAALTFPFPSRALRDVGVRLLAGYELGFAGYEYPYRKFLVSQLRQGDLVIDVGAHWGLYSLTATDLGPAGVNAVAVEALPGNVAYLQSWLNANRSRSNTTIVPAAIGARTQIAQFAESHSMGGRLADLASASKPHRLAVPVLTLDWLVEQLPAPSGRYVLKIDVEGNEVSVLRGARKLLRSGRVGAVIWEYHHEQNLETAPVAMDGLALLSDIGFRHYMFAHPHMGGLLLPFTPWPGVRNVISLPEDQTRPDRINQLDGPFAPLPPPYRSELSDGDRVAITRALEADGTSDAIRWIDPLNRSEGAQARVAAAADLIGAVDSVLDIGSGGDSLRRALPGATRFLGIDLVEPGEQGLLADLNQQSVCCVLGEQDAFDLGAVLGVLEYIHDPAGLLADLAKVCRRLVMTYDHSRLDAPDRRLARGYVNNLSSEALLAMLNAAGWTGAKRHTGDEFNAYLANRQSD